jgi:hypothetical protein
MSSSGGKFRIRMSGFASLADHVRFRHQCSEGGMTRDRYSMASTHETNFSNFAGSEAAFLGRPSQSYASMSMQGSPGEHYQPQLDASPAPPRGPFRGGRDSSPASSESADHYAERYRSYSGDVRDESAPILSSNYGPTSPMDESFPPRTGMAASQRYPDGEYLCVEPKLCAKY